MALFSSVEEKRKRSSRLADALLMQGADTSPVQHWTQGLARLSQALTGGYLSHLADKDAKDETKRLTQLMIPPGLRAPDSSSTPPAAATPGTYAPQTWAEHRAPLRTMNVTSPYGPRTHPITGEKGKMHEGVDLAAAPDTPVYASAPGRIVKMGEDAINGKFVVVQHNDGKTTSYSHLSGFGPFKQGDTITDPTNEIGYVGSTGRSTGPHLHFGTRNMAGTSSDPQGLFGQAAPPAQPPQVAQAPSATSTDAPSIPPAQRAYINQLINSGEPELIQMGVQLYQQYNKPQQPTDSMREYNYAVKQGYKGSLLDFLLAKKGPLVNVDTKGETKFAEGMDKHFADQYAKAMEGAQSARQKMATLQSLRDNLMLAGRTGFGAETLLQINRAAKALGLSDKDLGPAEAAQAIGNQLALQLRNPSSGAGMPGAMSDKDREFLVASVPGLTRTPEGNAQLIDYMMRVEKRTLEVADMMNRYVAQHGKLDPGFYAELSQWSQANPLFPEARGTTSAPTQRKRLIFNPSTGHIE